MLGAANIVAGNPGMTGTLTVRYRKPTPLLTPLRIEARCIGREGRKIQTWAGIYHGDLLTAEADGLFIEVNPAQFVAIAEGNSDNADPAVLEAMRVEARREGAAADVPGEAHRHGVTPEPAADAGESDLLAALPVRVAELALVELAVGVPGHRVGEVDRLRRLELGQPGGAVLEDLRSQLVGRARSPRPAR